MADADFDDFLGTARGSAAGPPLSDEAACIERLKTVGSGARPFSSRARRPAHPPAPQAWINEKAAPQLLAYEEEAIATLLAQIAEQDEASREGATNSVENAFLHVVYSMEISRLRFLVNAYLRTRLWKVPLQRHRASSVPTFTVSFCMRACRLSKTSCTSRGSPPRWRSSPAPRRNTPAGMRRGLLVV